MARCTCNLSITALCKLDLALVLLFVFGFDFGFEVVNLDGLLLSIGVVEPEVEVVSRRWGGTIIGVVRGGGGHCIILISSF